MPRIQIKIYNSEGRRIFVRDVLLEEASNLPSTVIDKLIVIIGDFFDVIADSFASDSHVRIKPLSPKPRTNVNVKEPLS